MKEKGRRRKGKRRKGRKGGKGGKKGSGYETLILVAKLQLGLSIYLKVHLQR